MSNKAKSMCPAKNSPLPTSSNIGSFAQAPPTGLPLHAYQPHWNPGPGPVFNPNGLPYGQQPNFMPPLFPNDPESYPNHMNNPLVSDASTLA